MTERRAGFITGVLTGAVWAAAVVLLGVVLLDPFGGSSGVPDDARDVIEDNYFRSVDPQQLDGASVDGMVRELRDRYDDRFSHYFGPRELRHFNAATEGSFSGVGLTVNEVKAGLRVASVLPDTPAEKAGINEGDLITEVDGKSIAGLSSQVSTSMIKGPPGSEVELRVVPAGGGGADDVTLERADVRVPAAVGELRTVGGRKVAYVRYATFSQGSHGELRSEIERLRKRGAEGLVLDLRGNGGGLLQEAVLSASVFVEHGVIVSTRSRTQGDQELDAVGDAIAPLPTVVLIDRNTASAAEILAAALQHYGLATIVGTRSFGKGTFQEVIDLPDDSGAIDLTIGEYLTASGKSIANEGVKPDVRAKEDPQVKGDQGLERGLAVVDRRLEGR